MRSVYRKGKDIRNDIHAALDCVSRKAIVKTKIATLHKMPMYLWDFFNPFIRPTDVRRPIPIKEPIMLGWKSEFKGYSKLSLFRSTALKCRPKLRKAKSNRDNRKLTQSVTCEWSRMFDAGTERSKHSPVVYMRYLRKHQERILTSALTNEMM